MQLPVLENAYFLQSLGWAIVNSFWQIGSLWLLYQFVTKVDKKSPAISKYHLSVVLLSTSFAWFIYTIVQNYLSLIHNGASAKIIVFETWLLKIQPVLNLVPILSIVYLLFLCLYTFTFVKNLSANRFLQKDGLTKAPLDFRLFASRTALHLGIKRKIHVWMSEHVEVPSVTGFIRPFILLPAAVLSHLSVNQIEAILLHELAHIKRNDYLINLLQSLVVIILFFNPFAVLLSKAAKRERENCCDDWVMNFQYGQFEYAKALLVLEEQRYFHQFRFALAATNGKKNLLLRVKRLFNTSPQTNFSTFQKLRIIGLCLLLTVAIFSFLPYMTKKSVPAKKIVSNKENKMNLVKFYNSLQEHFSKILYTRYPAKSHNRPSGKATKTKEKKPIKTEPAADYVNAFINEELLNPARKMEPTITSVVDKEINNSKFLIIIEDQQSGIKPINTYYFELTNKEGNAAIKPLIMLNKTKSTLKTISVDSLNGSRKRLPSFTYKQKISS